MNKKNLLLVCLNIRDFDKVFKLDLSSFSKVIIASDDLKVHKKIKEVDFIDHVVFLQKSISYLEVADTVMKMIDDVNSYFFEISKKNIFSKQDIFWPYLVEGGYNQVLQDLLIGIDSAHLILDQHMITELIIIGDNNILPVKLLKKIALKRNFKVSSYNPRIVLDKNLVKNLIRPVYLFLKSLICKISSCKTNYSKHKNIVLFQIHGNSLKNIQNALFLQNEFFKNKFFPVNILWGSAQEVKKINKMGYKAISLEYYLKYKDIFFSLWRAIFVIRKAKKLKNLFFSNHTFTYKNVDIRDLLFETILKYLYTEAPENLKYRLAAKRFVLEFSKNIVAIKYSAVKFLAQSTILSNVVEDKYLKFDYDSGLRAKNPYVKYGSKKYKNFLSNNFVRFSANESERQIVIEDTDISEDSVTIYGAGRASKHFLNKKFIKKLDSMKKIGIRKNYDIYVLLPLNNPFIGYSSLEEIYYVFNTMIEFSKLNDNIAILVKPNYLTELSLFSDFIDDDYENIYIIDKDELPDHALNISDVIICKNSYLGVEAMIYDQQVVSVSFDNIKNFKVFGDSAYYINSVMELKTFIEKTFNSKDNFIKLKNSFSEKRKIFLRETYPVLKKRSEEIVVDVIKKKLDNKVLSIK